MINNTPPPRRKIVHVDMDSFFCSVEALYDHSLKGKPFAVGGTPEKRGVISTASYEARKFQVGSGMSSYKAMKLCPHLIILPPNFRKYKEESVAICEIFQRFTGLIEPLSLDEAFLDVTGTRLFNGSATLIAQEIRHLIYKERKLTASAGIAPNKFLAKIASDWKKPDGQFVITPEQINDFMKQLPIERVYGVGRATSKKLHEMKISTCGDLQNISCLELKNVFGVWGEDLYDLCRGIDDRPVVTEYERKSFSVENTYSHDLKNLQECLDKLPVLFDEFIEHLNDSNNNYFIKSLFAKLKFYDFKTTTVERATYKQPSVENYSALIKEGYKRGNKPVRLLGIGVKIKDKRFIETFEQLELKFDQV